jgi:hypothetical protein
MIPAELALPVSNQLLVIRNDMGPAAFGRGAGSQQKHADFAVGERFRGCSTIEEIQTIL